MADTTDAVFTILPSSVITVTSPNGGEVYPALTGTVITWNNTADASGLYNVAYSADSGGSWTTIATGISGNSYNWTSIPNNPSTKYLIRVSDNQNTCYKDVSNAVFTVTPAQPVLTYPNGGESLWAASAYNITWNASSFYTNVRLEYSLDNGVTWQLISSGVSNSGSYNWTLPNVGSTTCLVKASNVGNVILNDVSDAVFTIKPVVRVFTPNGFDQLGACTQTSITFDHTPAYTSYNIQYSTNNGISWTTIATNQTFSGTSGTYSWTVPNIPTTQALVKVYPYGQTSLSDVSDTTFTIKRAVTIIQPNFGGVLQVGTSYPIIWSSDGISNLYDIAYSTNGGSTWTNIVLGYNTSTNTYNWTVPNIPSTNCLIRIRDNISSCKEDISDIPFTISSTAAAITVTAPNGQDTLSGCQNYPIHWTENGSPLGSYNIDYTTNGGQTWLPIVANYATTAGTYNWVVPNTNTSTALIRVSSSANGNIFDLSNAAFTINSRSVTATPDTVICSGNQVQLFATGGTGIYTWTPTSTLSNASIANPVATPTSTTNYVVSSGNGTCFMRDTATVTVLNGNATNVGVTIAASPSAAVCAGSIVLFTATATNGGANPVYQWKKNGVNVGNNSANYQLNPPTDNDLISCVLTSDAVCATNNPATSNLVTVTVFNSVTPTVTISTSSTTVCAAQSVTFTANATNTGNAPVYQWYVNNIPAGTNSSTFVTTTLNNNDVVTCQLTSNAACLSTATASSNALLMTVTPSVTPTISISTPATTICNGSSVTFSAITTNGGNLPSYQWKVNGINVGGNNATYTTTTLTNNSVVTCTLVSNATCALPASVVSNTINMSVTGSVAPAVSVNSSATNICSGQSVTFTAVPVNGGSTPTYQWQVNGFSAGSTASTFTTSALSNNDSVTVSMVSSSGCAVPNSAISNPVVITVNPNVSPSVTIAGNNTICDGTQVTFTATLLNAGSNPVYQWKLNNNNTGGNSSTYTSSALANSDSIYCIVTSSSTCATPNTASSNTIGITVASNVTPSVSVSTTTNNICAGSNVIFTANAVNGGTNPSYQWKVNSNNVGSNSASYSSTTLADNDVVTCVLTSNAACAVPAVTTSNAVTMSVASVAAPTVTVTTANNNICSGSSATFTANVTNGGANPTYQWKVNGINAGGNNATYTTTTLTNNDVVTCLVHSSALCASPDSALSNAVTVTVGSVVTPSVSISASATAICAGSQVTFTANATGGGASPSYQWKVNGINAGTNSVTFATTTLSDNDVVTCTLVSSLACVSSASAVSNAITITVASYVTPTIVIAASSNPVCGNAPVTFTAAITNGGANPVYQWKLNSNIVGGNSPAYVLAAPANGDLITCQLTSGAQCATSSSVLSNTVTMALTTPVTPSVTITASDTNICNGPVTFTAVAANGGNMPTYQWLVNGNNAGTNSNTYTTSALNNNDVVTCVLTSNAACVSANTASSNPIKVISTAAAPVVSIATNNGTACAGTAVVFTATLNNAGTSQAYQWKVNGTNAGNNSSTFSTNTLNNNDTVSCEVTVVSACAGTTTVQSNELVITITPQVVPTVNITASQNGICEGTVVTFTATAINAGTNPIYQWHVNGVNTGTNSNQFVSTTLANSDTVICVLTSNATCAAPAVVTSPSVIMNVTPSVTLSVNITPVATTICQGTNVTFNATVVNGGANPAYQWKVNNNNFGTNSSVFSSNSLANGDVVYCEVSGSAACYQPATASSNAVTVNVSIPVTPSVSITASSTTICSNDSVTFTAVSANGGTAPVYQWMVNGMVLNTGNNTYVSSTLSNGDVVSCRLISNAACVTTDTALSNTVVISTATSVTPGISINASTSTICSGTPVTFTATAINGGSSPTYQWLVNGINTGSNSSSFSSSNLNNGDAVTCILTTSAACATVDTVMSSPIIITVNNGVQPTVSVTASNDTICPASTVVFVAVANNAGTPQYSWLVNNSPTGIVADTFTSSTLTDGDIVVCQITSSAGCSNGTIVTSAPDTIHVSSTVTPNVSVSVLSNTVCSGQNVVFTATGVNAGASPVYQWQVNGINTGSNSTTFASNTLANNDVVTVMMTGTQSCASAQTVTSSPITMVVDSTVTPSVTISLSPADTICQGTNVLLTAIPVNGGAAPAYQWKLNGNNTGTNANTYSSNSFLDGDILMVEMTSNANCVAQATVTSTAKVLTVNSLPAAPVISQSGNVLTSSAPVGNQWYASSQPISGAIAQSYTVNGNGWYSVKVTDENGCSTVGDSIFIQYTGIEAIDWNKDITVKPNPFAEQFYVSVSASALTNGDWTMNITDAIGKLVYENKHLQPYNTIDFTHRPSGMYFVNIKNGNEVHTYKVVKQ